MIVAMRHLHPNTRSRGDSESSGSGSGKFKNFLNRPKNIESQDRRRSEPIVVNETNPGITNTTTTTQSMNNSSSFDTTPPMVLQRRRKEFNGVVDFEENPPIPSSPSGTPPKKIWEGAYSKFLRGNKSSAASPTSSSLSSAASVPKPSSSPTEISASLTTTSGAGKKSSFSLIPGSKRLVSRSGTITPRSPGGNVIGDSSRLVPVDAANVPPFPSLRTSPRSPSHKTGGHNVNIDKDAGILSSLDVPPPPSGAADASGGGEDGSVRGGKLFKAVFSRSANDVRGRNGRHNRHQSMDALDIPMRNGIEKSSSSSSPDYYNTNMLKHFPSSLLATEATNRLLTPQITGAVTPEENEESGEYNNLDELLASAATTTPSSQRIMIPVSAQRVASMNGLVHPVVNDGVELPPSMPSAPSLRQLQPRAQPYSYGAYNQQQQHQHSYYHRHDRNFSLPGIPPLPPSPNGYNRTSTTSDHSHQQVGLTLDDSDNSHLDRHEEQHDSRSGGSAPQNSLLLEPPEHLDQILGDPAFVVTTTSFSSSPPNSFSLHPPLDIKRAFTNFHNASKFARDSTSPFLGGDASSNVDLAGAYDSYVSYHAMLMRSAGGNSVPYQAGSAMSDRNLTSSSYLLSRSLPLETVDEQNISIHTGLRLLKPIQGTESWQQGRRYLIAPAALAACPLPAINKLSGTLIQSASDAAAQNSLQAFGMVDLGEALMTYVGDKHHLSLGKWSSCRLVLRQNYLFEYDLSTPIAGLPRAYAHLQYAVAYPHADFQDALELHFYASPCAKADHRILMIRVPNREDRDHWITCLNDASKLLIEDLWEVDKERPFGTGRYASVFPARRKTKQFFEEQEATKEDCPDRETSSKRYNCALKIVDKNQFWRRVVKGKERSDTLVRELAVQSTLTAKCGRIPTFLQLRGFFETSDNVVIEMELLEGKDLFEFISSKGVLGEGEAGLIIRDVLTSLDCMSRVGLAHRDVKPANILMANQDNDSKATVKLGDFGMSTFVGVDGLVRGRCGTPGYVAPEVLKAGTRAGYGNQGDVFSAGVTLYVMLSGYEPFYGETEKELIEANRLAAIDFPKSDWGRISPEARDLVERMVKADPTERITAREALQHPWITKLENNPKLDSSTPTPNKSLNKNLALPSSDAPEEGVCMVM